MPGSNGIALLMATFSLYLLKATQKLANSAGYKNWQQAQIDIQQVVDVVATFSQVALELDVEKKTVKEVQEVLGQRWQENNHLLL